VLSTLLSRLGVDEEHMGSAFVLLDRREKLENDALEAMAFEFGITGGDFIAFLKRPRGRATLEELLGFVPGGGSGLDMIAMLRAMEAEIGAVGATDWCDVDFNVVRGLAYYTGMVFELHEASGAERAIAGGGRYDNLIETFGGPATPSVGFGMGDVVLSLVLQDRGLLPEGKDLLGALSAPSASLRPDVFVISNGTPGADAQVRPLVAHLRRGEEAAAWLDKSEKKPWDAERYTVPPLHARHSYKATKNVGKLLQEATSSHARFAVIVENEREVTVRDLDRREEIKSVAVADVGARAAGTK
jgi:histidyl-tRNA synthetase